MPAKGREPTPASLLCLLLEAASPHGSHQESHLGQHLFPVMGSQRRAVVGGVDPGTLGF